MTTTTITPTNRSHSLTAHLHDAFHVRAWLTGSEPLSADNSRVTKRPQRSRDDQATMLVTFAGRYGARF